MQVAADLPIVSLMTPVDGMESVFGDDEGGGYAATCHLLDLGHRRIATLHGYLTNPSATDRTNGYYRALNESGIDAKPQWARLLEGSYYWGKRFTIEARRIVAQWLREDRSQLGCTALVCHNNEAAFGAIQAFTEAGLRVLDDVSVIVFDGTGFCDLVSPGISSVELPLREIGSTAVHML